MKNLTSHPYAFASAVFLAVVIFGGRLFLWGPRDYAFLLLLYFIVTLGIRLDEISRQIATTNELLQRMLQNSSDAGRGSTGKITRD